MSNVLEIASFISFSDEIRGRRACIAGTGVSVQRIIRWYQSGLSPEEIADQFGHLNLEQIHAALAFYHANHEIVDSEIARDDAAAEQAQTD